MTIPAREMRSGPRAFGRDRGVAGDGGATLLSQAATESGYRWLAACVASWFGAWGMQLVLFSWLVVGELEASPEWVGVAQTSTMIPSLLLLLMGGVAADRIDPRTLLARLHLAAVIPGYPPLGGSDTFLFPQTRSLYGLSAYQWSVGSAAGGSVVRPLQLGSLCRRDLQRRPRLRL